MLFFKNLSTSRPFVIFCLILLFSLIFYPQWSKPVKSQAGGNANLKVAFIGDDGNTADSKAVLQLIKSEGAAFVVDGGDLEYENNPTLWDTNVTSVLGDSYPYFVARGNHDLAQWSGYSQKLQTRLTKTTGAQCTGAIGVQQSCLYRGIHILLIDPARAHAGKADYIKTQFSQSQTKWRVCVWHENMSAMQVGDNADEAGGYDIYEACREMGAIIANAHEHSYERTKTLTNFANQTVDPVCNSARFICVALGKTFLFVSGLGGKSVSEHLRCLPATPPYGCKGEWAFIYASKQNADFGALFIDFNVGGDPNKAKGYFKTINGQVVDQFDITLGNTPDSNPTPTNFVCGGAGINCIPSATPPTGGSNPTLPIPTSVPTTPVPTLDPCENAAVSVQSHKSKHKSKGNGAVRSITNSILELLINLLNMILRLLGGQPIMLPTNPGAPQPTAVPQPTNLPVPTMDPGNPQPTGAPQPTNLPTPTTIPCPPTTAPTQAQPTSGSTQAPTQPPLSASTEFGFQRDPVLSDAGIVEFKKDVDDMASHGLKWIRLGIASWDVISGINGTNISWNEKNLSYFDQSIDYARQKGLKIVLTTAESPSENSPLETYKSISANYWSFLAQRYKGKISIWQVFNEADGSHYKSHNSVSITDAYTGELNGVLAVARQTIKGIDPNIIITTNSTGWPMNDTTQATWMKFFDGIKDNLDMITLDLYPATDFAEVNKLNQRVNATKQRYNKPVSIGEIGLQTCTGCWSEQEQQESIVASLNNLKLANPTNVLVYEYRDAGPNKSEGLMNFGIIRYDGTHKSSYDAIMNAMK